MLNILVIMNLSDMQKQTLRAVAEDFHLIFEPDKELAEAYIPEADIIIGNPSPEAIHASPKLKLLQLRSAGTDVYIVPSVLAENTILTNATGAYDQSVAEHGLALTLMLQKKFHLYRGHQARREWKDEGVTASIASSTVLVVGFGSIGMCYARMAKALGAKVIGVKRRISEKPDCAYELYTFEHMDDLLPRADVIFSVLPNTKETMYFFTPERFEKMKPNAVFINCGRGNAVSAETLKTALEHGEIAAAACDVFEKEPLPEESPLWKVENLMITPHTAGGNHLSGTQDRIVEIAAQNIRAVLGKGEYRNIIDRSTGYKK